MHNLSIDSLLQLTASVIGLELIIFAVLLNKSGLFRWNKAGFWAWIAFLLYFVLTPLSVIITGDIYEYKVRLAIAGGSDRGLWIAFNAFIGIFLYFYIYIKTKGNLVTWGLSRKIYHLSVSSFVIILMCFGFGLYSLVSFRSGLLGNNPEVFSTNSRFTGNITGYQYVGYIFMFVPTLLLLLSPGKRERLIGWVLCIMFILLSMPDARSRFVTVSMILSLSILDALKRRTKWPNILILIVLLVSAVVYQLRGHVKWEITDMNRQVVSLLSEVPDRITTILTESDTAMLASWYISSYLHDHWIGYDYGIPLINYILFGFIPTRFFPQKYFLIEMFRSWQGNSYPLIIDQYLYGSKSSLLGDFYENGGVFGVLLGMALAGYFSKRLDGMLMEETPTLIKAVALAWLSMFWIAWGSGSFWIFTLFGSIVLPAIALWFVSWFSDKVNMYKFPAPMEQAGKINRPS